MKKSLYRGKRSVLLVSPDETDYVALREIVHAPAWTLLQAHNPIEARQVLGDCAVDAVIADSQCWKSLLVERWTLEFPLIVADRLADNRLWAEVLNLGGYDLMLKPFEAKTVQHILSCCGSRRAESIASQSLNLHGCSEGRQAAKISQNPPRRPAREIRALTISLPIRLPKKDSRR